MAFKYKQGLYTPINPKKYIGNVKNIFFRSGWEHTVMEILDTSSKVIRWASEELEVPYYNELDKKMHKYYPDFLATIIENGLEVTYMMEIKPSKQTVAPKYRNSKKYLAEMTEYKKNEYKWKAAQILCKSKNWKFIVITEKSNWAKFL